MSFTVFFVWCCFVRVFPVFWEAQDSFLFYVYEAALSSDALEVYAEVCQVAIDKFGVQVTLRWWLAAFVHLLLARAPLAY